MPEKKDKLKPIDSLDVLNNPDKYDEAVRKQVAIEVLERATAMLRKLNTQEKELVDEALGEVDEGDLDSIREKIKNIT